MATQTGLTLADLQQLPGWLDGRRYELSEGELLEVGNAAWIHELVKANLHAALSVWAVQTQRGKAFSEILIPLSADTARIPDVAFARREKLLAQQLDRLIAFVPDLAIEVISDSETANHAEKKASQYFAAGVIELWQVYPEQRFVRIRRGKSTTDFLSDDLLHSDVLPGFECRVADLFQV